MPRCRQLAVSNLGHLQSQCRLECCYAPEDHFVTPTSCTVKINVHFGQPCCYVHPRL